MPNFVDNLIHPTLAWEFNLESSCFSYGEYVNKHHKYLMLPEDKKTTVKKKEVFISAEIKNTNLAYEYLRVLHQYHMSKIKQERAEKFLHNEKEANKAYPNIDLELWDTELEINMLKSYIKKF